MSKKPFVLLGEAYMGDGVWLMELIDHFKSEDEAEDFILSYSGMGFGEWRLFSIEPSEDYEGFKAGDYVG